MSFSIPIILLFLIFFLKKSKNNSNNEPNKALKRDRETQKCCDLLNKTHCFTIYIAKIKDLRLTKHLKVRERGI